MLRRWPSGEWIRGVSRKLSSGVWRGPEACEFARPEVRGGRGRRNGWGIFRAVGNLDMPRGDYIQRRPCQFSMVLAGPIRLHYVGVGAAVMVMVWRWRLITATRAVVVHVAVGMRGGIVPVRMVVIVVLRMAPVGAVLPVLMGVFVRVVSVVDSGHRGRRVIGRGVMMDTVRDGRVPLNTRGNPNGENRPKYGKSQPHRPSIVYGTSGTQHRTDGRPKFGRALSRDARAESARFPTEV